jgi:para-nitrobenzyl esterase
MRRFWATTAAAFATLTGTAALAAGPDTVRIEAGPLHGAVSGTVASFKGVPYAEPPVGALRWAPPRKAAAWSTPKDAVAFGPSCPQGPPVVSLLSGAASGPTAEDCLTLNVWAPVGAAASAKGAPIMVWLHGGGNEQGGSAVPYYDGASFARDGVVLVTVNYRLGPLGFFAHPALVKAALERANGADLVGNYGLMDQIAALRWVKRNARAFGGDPKRVTVFGESAGGQDILLLLASNAARGLFAQAIVESGGGWGTTPSLADAEARGQAAASAAGLPDATIDQLRALPVSTFDATPFRRAAGPMVDGTIVSGPSIAQSFRDGRARSVPMIIGSNAGEDSLTTRSAAATALAKLSPERLAALRVAYPGADDALLGQNLFRDSVMGAPAHWIAGQVASTGQSVWLYHFAFVPPAVRSFFPRAVHGGEIPFVFETIDKAPIPPKALTDADRAYAATVHGCWVSFAKTGAPACPGAPPWPAYTRATDATYVFGDAPHLETGFLKAPYAVQYDILKDRGGTSGAF